MKNIFLSVLAISSFSFAGNVVEVNGAKAKEVMSALKVVGVVARQHIDSSDMSVSNVKVNYTPRGFIHAQASLTDNVSFEYLNPIGSPAYKLFIALKKAGAASEELESFIGSSNIYAKQIQCHFGSIGNGRLFAHCTIEQ